MTTIADALGPAARPLAEIVAQWRALTPWQRLVLRATSPEVHDALVRLDDGFDKLLGPP